MKKSDKNIGKVTFEPNLRPKPYPHELNAGRIIAEYFKTDIVFLRRGPGASPDILIHNVIWELKSPIGNGKRTVANILREANSQSQNIFLDLSRCKMREERAIARTKEFLRGGRHTIKRLKIITKSEKIIDILP